MASAPCLTTAAFQPLTTTTHVLLQRASLIGMQAARYVHAITTAVCCDPLLPCMAFCCVVGNAVICSDPRRHYSPPASSAWYPLLLPLELRMIYASQKSCRVLRQPVEASQKACCFCGAEWWFAWCLMSIIDHSRLSGAQKCITLENWRHPK